MLEQLKEEVHQASLDLPKHGPVEYTWGNVSASDPETQYFVVKSSGISYEEMTAGDMVVVDLDNHTIEGKLSPSSDMPIHAVLYRSFSRIGGIIHTYSARATIWAQTGSDVPAMGTVHADTSHESALCARFLTQQEINGGYEHETGGIIIETFEERKIDPLAIPGIFLHGHGLFARGKDAQSTVMNVVVLDEACKTDLFTGQFDSFSEELPQRTLDKHYL